jgi:hypothetical protein
MACGSTCGITRERAKELDRARRRAVEVHGWRPREGSPRALSFDALLSLGHTLEELLPLRAHVHAGEGDACDSLFLLAGLHEPSLAAVLDDSLLVPGASALHGETYLRIAISPYGRYAVVQEVRAECEVLHDGLAIVLEPQAGVVDRRLQLPVKGALGALRKAHVVVLDLGATLAPLGLEGDEEASLWSCLFETTSPLAPMAFWLPSTLTTSGRQPNTC